MTHPWVAAWGAEPKRPGPWMDTDPPVRDYCDRCRDLHDTVRLRQLLNHLADLDDHQRDVIEGYKREVANLTQANAALRRATDTKGAA